MTYLAASCSGSLMAMLAGGVFRDCCWYERNPAGAAAPSVCAGLSQVSRFLLLIISGREEVNLTLLTILEIWGC